MSLLRWIEKGALAAAVHKEHWLAAAWLLFVRSGGTMVLSLKVKGPGVLQGKKCLVRNRQGEQNDWC